MLRSTPCLIGFFSVVVLIYAEHLREHKPSLRQTPWYEKNEPTFADAFATVRQLMWPCIFLRQPDAQRAWKNLPSDLRATPMARLCYAA